jgi:tetratricopeptide (TPR) repeat protein
MIIETFETTVKEIKFEVRTLKKMKNRLSLFCAFALFFPSVIFAQLVKQAPDPEKFTNKELKKIEKSQQLYHKNKFEKAIALLKPIQETHLLNEQLWSLRVDYQYYNYLQQANNEEMNAGKHTNFFVEPGEAAKEELLVACSLATLYCKNAETASIYLRILTVDKKVDKNVKSDAKDEFDEGENAFENGRYEAAQRHYKNAYDADTNYYKAALYLGDSYFKDKEYEEALPWYQKAVRMHPELMEGHKYLTDDYRKLHRWKEAYDACVDAIICYPDVSMFIMMDDICDGLDEKFDKKWMPRFYLPNSPGIAQDPIAEEPWSFYRHAKNEGESNFNKVGVKFGKDSTVSCFEVYSWEQMLENDKTHSENLQTAREMKKDGYLDCYVMVSLFHITFYPQYRYFADANADRIRKYFATYLVKPI